MKNIAAILRHCDADLNIVSSGLFINNITKYFPKNIRINPDIMLVTMDILVHSLTPSFIRL